MAEQVKVPKPMFDHMEEQLVAYKEMREALENIAVALKGYKIKAVITEPPSGRDAAVITEAVNTLFTIVRPQ